MIDFESHKIVVVSTAHISRKDNELLRIADYGLSVYPLEYGYFVYLSKDETAKSIDQNGYSSGFAKVYLEAAKSGAKYMQLDCDGPTYDEFETFDW